MKKDSIIQIAILAVIILCFVIGAIAYEKVGPAALTYSFSHSQCVNQKCVAVGGMGISNCSSDSDCITHMVVNNLSQCIAVNGPGSDQCSAADNSAPVKDPQQWCQSNNPGTGLTVTADVYPNGNFSCNCEYKVDGKISQAPCANSHLQ